LYIEFQFLQEKSKQHNYIYSQLIAHMSFKMYVIASPTCFGY